MKTYSSYGSGLTPPSRQSLWDILVAAIQHLPEAFIIIDALDECQEIEAVSSWLKNLASASSTSLHVLFTSRDIPLLSDQISHIRHESLRVDKYTVADIDLFITEKIAESELRGWSGELQDNIRESLRERANGM